MPIDPGQFWGENYYNHPPLTVEMIRVAESTLGVTLPEEYLALLRIQNGGYTQGFGYPMSRPTSWSENHVPLPELAGIITDPGISTVQNILLSAEMADEWGIPPRQVLLAGDGHWWITLDYRDGQVPAVAWIDTECDEDFQVADTFAAFIDGLWPVHEFQIDA